MPERFLRGADPKIHAKITAEITRLEKALGRRLTTDEIFDLAVKIDKDYRGFLVHRSRPKSGGNSGQ